MILITIDNNQDFMRVRMNRNKSSLKRRRRSWFGGSKKKPLMAPVMR